MAASEKHRRLQQDRRRRRKVIKLKTRIADSTDRQERERLLAKLYKIAPHAEIPS